MALRCLLFSSDEKTAQPVRQVLAALGIEAEYCATAVEAVQAVTNEQFHLVVVDWDDQPEAAFLLNASRERKAAERPLTLAVVGHDANVPQALQAGASSVLRKPVQPQQAKSTLTTARDLLRAKLESAAPMAKASAAAASAAASAAVSNPDMEIGHADPKPLRAGEFLQPSTAPSAQFDTQSEMESEATEIDPLDELEPMASAVPKAPPASKSAPAPGPEAPADNGPRGLEWYLKNRSGAAPGVMQHAAASAPAPAPAKPELLSFDQAPAAAEQPAQSAQQKAPSEAAEAINFSAHKSEQKEEAALFAYIEGEEPEDESKSGTSRPWVRKAVLAGIMAAVVAVAYVGIPKSVWHENIRLIAVNVFHAGHNWLNPQPVTPAQAPRSHESFGRAGDEYKLPVAETIPDATTDPSQIRVLPVVDPSAKQPNAAAGQNSQPGADPFAPPADGQQQTAPAQSPDGSVPQTSPAVAPSAGAPNVEASGSQPAASASQTPAATTPVEPPPAHVQAPTQAPPAQTSTPAQSSAPAPAPQLPAVQKSAPPAASGIPTSLKSNMTTSTPEASGNKPVDAALPAIEPVELPEATVRNLILEQSQLPYPDSAKGQSGSVVLAVLIGRDGSVQDAKFLQGSLAFARGAIDSVKQWKFKPYLLNNRPVSVQTLLTLTFRPGA